MLAARLLASGRMGPSTPPPPPAPDDLVQFNTRIPRSLREAIDSRRAQVRGGLSQSAWIANAARFALDHAPASGHHDNSVGRTAPPPTRRPGSSRS